MKMKSIDLFLVAIIVVLLVSPVYAQRIGRLPAIAETHKNMFKTMVRNYFHPVIHGWGVGYDCDSDTYVTAKFHVVDVKILPRTQITQIIRNARATNVTDWSVVMDEIKTAIDVNGTSVKKGRVSINGEKFLLTNIQTGDTLSADIREIPDFSSCKVANISAEDCELNAKKVGDITITKRAGTELPGEPRVWGGTLNFRDNSYKFVALAYPRSLA